MKNEEMDMITIVVGEDGLITLPANLRDISDNETGDKLKAYAADEILVLTPRALRTPELIDQMVTLMDEAGLTLDDMLRDLPDIRQSLCDARYGR